MPYFIDNAGLATSPSLVAQAAYIANARQANWNHEAAIAAATGVNLAVNDARIPGDVWRDFDRAAKMVMTDPTMDVILNDLAPLSRNVDVGKIVSEYRQRGDGSMEVRTSIDGNHAKPIDHSKDQYDGSLIPVHSTQIGRQWRELAGMRSEGYDALIDDQADALRHIRRRMADDIVNGTSELQYKGRKSLGIKANPNTLALNLGASGVNVNVATGTIADARKAFVAALKELQGSGNNAQGDVTFYISADAWFNMISQVDAQRTDKTGIDILREIPGVAAIKRSGQLAGNEFIAMVLSAEYIRPIVGMPVTSTPIPRVTPMDNYHILVWSAAGLQIRADASGRSGVLYAAAV